MWKFSVTDADRRVVGLAADISNFAPDGPSALTDRARISDIIDFYCAIGERSTDQAAISAGISTR
ncbi:hypothetical protein [Kibdelosporangium aridum]|uniref:hypothetical protein n=1 Tax=Kibdelosporangium aridum TaxID=2030 RepID=UPI00190EAB78|nr:hypothetical protein [Kibdelosporangium aridum]